MLNQDDEYETDNDRIDSVMIERSRLHLQETVSGGAFRGESVQRKPNNVKCVETRVEDVAEVAHLGGIVTQEMTGTFELGEVHSGVAFDLGDIAESIST